MPPPTWLCFKFQWRGFLPDPPFGVLLVVCFFLLIKVFRYKNMMQNEIFKTIINPSFNSREHIEYYNAETIVC